MANDGFRMIGATTYLCPTPTVLVGCAADDGWQRGEGRANLVTVAWAGICCTKPPMISISLRPERYSHELIQCSGEFTVNLIGEPLLHAMDFCGVKSGRDMDKFERLGLHATQAEGLLAAPALLEAPAHLCCKVKQVLPLGTHDLFLAEIVGVSVNERYFREDGSIDEQAMKLVAYVHGKYRALGAELGFFGFSVAGEDALKRRAKAAKAAESPAVKAAVARLPGGLANGASALHLTSGRTARGAGGAAAKSPKLTKKHETGRGHDGGGTAGNSQPDRLNATTPKAMRGKGKGERK